MPLTKEGAAAVVRRRTKTIPSAIFGDDVLYRELTRAEWREALDYAATGEINTSGAPIILTDRWTAARFAAGVIDEASGEPIFTRDEILAWPNRTDLWDEAVRIVDAIDALSEVGGEALKSGDLPPDQG